MPRLEEPTPSENFAQEMETILRRACQLCQLGAWSLEVPSMALNWTREVREIHGVANDFVPIVETTIAFYTAESQPIIAHAVNQCLTNGIPYDEELQLVAAGGPAVWVRSVGEAVRDDQGSIVRIQGAFQDISQQKLAVEAMAQSEQRFRLLSRATSDAVYDFDLRSGQVWQNEGFHSLFGYSCRETTSFDEGWKSHLHPEDRDRVLASFRTVMDGGSDQWDSEYRFLCLDGRVAQVRDRAYLIRDEDGKTIRVIGSMTDITARQKLEQQVLRAERLESIATMAGGLAHDLNNLLAPILLSTEILSDYVVNDSEGQSVLATVKSSAERASLLIRGILGFAQSLDGERTFLDLRQLTEEIEETVRQTFPKNIHFSRTASQDLWTVSADVNQICQVLLSLCFNARDAMPDGGALRISLLNVAVDEVMAALDVDCRPGIHVVLRVEDTGCGMSPEVQSRIFEPFFTTKGVGEGSGLALSTAYSIVRGHGGFIQVYSEPGQGTKFDIHLPASKHPAVQGPHVNVQLSVLPKGNGELVLLVDDDDDVRDIAQKALERFGYRVLPAGDGAVAVALFNQRRLEIDVVLTDMSMPVMDGPTMISALKAIDPEVRVIGSSGLVSSSNVARAASVGVEHFVAKPYTAAALLQTLQAVLSQPAVSPTPVPQKSPALERTPLIKAPSPLNGKRLLVVDDEQAIRKLSKRVLERNGFLVLTAESAEEALPLLESPGFFLDGLITDLNLPGMDGYELARLVRERFPLVKVILVSGTFLKADTTAERCVLPKPYSSTALLDAVTEMLDGESAR